MDTTFRPKARTIAELLPGLHGLMSENHMQTLTAKKQPRNTKPVTLTSEKVMKPMTIAEMRAEIQALKIQSPKKLPHGGTSSKKKWNSSVKVEKKIISHTADGQMKHNTVRKVLNFQQPKPKIPKMTHAKIPTNSETPKFTKPQMITKSHQLRASNAVRISGIGHIPDTPPKSRPMKISNTKENKENIIKPVVNKKIAVTPQSSLRKRLMLSQIPDTPLSNLSWKSSCDTSFLQNEKDIEYIESKSKALSAEHTLENIAEVSPPVSTPFQEYRNVKEFFSNSSDVLDNSSAAYQDNTIMCLDKTAVVKENSKREESVIVSLCDMLNKATMSNINTQITNTELEHLLEFEKQTLSHLSMIENGITLLMTLKESQSKSLKHVRKLIDEKKKASCENVNDKTAIETNNYGQMEVDMTPEKSPAVNMLSPVIKSCLKSPSYKIPRKSMSWIKKKVIFKSMPNVSDLKETPPKPMGHRALSMYMKMKENMEFLTTPVVKKRVMNEPSTPAITSKNLQLQLQRLCGES